MIERTVFHGFLFVELQAFRKSNLDVDVMVLEANTIIYDSTAWDRGFMVPADVLRKSIPKGCVPLWLFHDHRERLGELCNFKYNPFKKALFARLKILPEKRQRVLELIQNESINGISLELTTLEARDKYYNKVLKMTITGAALVDKPACKKCRVKPSRSEF